MTDVWLRLRFARKIEVDQLRRLFIAQTLTAIDYDVRQAKRAELWLLHGDWRFKGADPTVDLSDFTPTEEQYNQTFVKLWAKVPLPKSERFEDSQSIPEPIDPEALEMMKGQLNRVFQRYGIAPIGGDNA